MFDIAPGPTLSTPRNPKTLRKWAFAFLLVLALLFLHWLLVQGYEYIPGVLVRPLGPCDVMWFGNKGGVLVLGCPHTDMLKFWPLPLEQPWWEDPPHRGE